MIPKKPLTQKLKLELTEELHLALIETELNVSKPEQEKLVDYLLILHEWNSVHNLTGIKDPFQMLRLHLLDSLVLMPILTGERIIDIGSGAGVPGIPLAIVRPDLQFVLLDSNQKKMNFVQHVILSLKLKNAETVCQRVEKYQPEILFDWAVSRAFASLKEFVLAAMPLVKNQGMLLAMKGQNKQVEEEIKELLWQNTSGVTVIENRTVMVPLLQAERSLVLLRKEL